MPLSTTVAEIVCASVSGFSSILYLIGLWPCVCNLFQTPPPPPPELDQIFAFVHLTQYFIRTKSSCCVVYFYSININAQKFSAELTKSKKTVRVPFIQYLSVIPRNFRLFVESSLRVFPLIRGKL